MKMLFLAISCFFSLLAKSQAPKLSFIKNYQVHFQTDTGGDYLGEVNSAGRPDGIGSMNYADTVWYLGQFQNGEITGEGTKLFIASGKARLGHFERGELTGQYIATTGTVLSLLESKDHDGIFLRTSAVTAKYLINSMYSADAQPSKTCTILSLDENDDISLYYCPKTEASDFNGNTVVYKSVNAEVEFQKIPHGDYAGIYSENGINVGYSLMKSSHITADVERITGGPLPLWLQDGIYLKKNENDQKFFARGAQINNPGIFSMEYGAVANRLAYSNFSRINPDLNPYGFMQDAIAKPRISYSFWMGDFTMMGNNHHGSGIVDYGNPNNSQYVLCMGELQEDVAGKQTDCIFR